MKLSKFIESFGKFMKFDFVGCRFEISYVIVLFQ